MFKKNASLEKQIINSYHRYIFDYNDIANKLSFRRADKKHHENIKLFINNELDYYTSLYAKISTCGDEFVQYNLNINDISGLYQQIMAACDVNDELTDEKIHAIAKEADRLWVLFVLNGIYDSNDFQDVSYRLNEKLKGLDMASYREVYDEIIMQSIREKRNVSGEVSLLDFNSFLRKTIRIRTADSCVICSLELRSLSVSIRIKICRMISTIFLLRPVIRRDTI